MASSPQQVLWGSISAAQGWGCSPGDPGCGPCRALHRSNIANNNLFFKRRNSPLGLTWDLPVRCQIPLAMITNTYCCFLKCHLMIHLCRRCTRLRCQPWCSAGSHCVRALQLLQPGLTCGLSLHRDAQVLRCLLAGLLCWGLTWWSLEKMEPCWGCGVTWRK